MQIKVNHTLWVYSSGNGEKLLSFCSLQQKSFWKECWFQALLWKWAACDFIPLAVMVTILSCKWWCDLMGERVVPCVISINLLVNTWPRTHMFCNYVSLKKPAISPQCCRMLLVFLNFLLFFFSGKRCEEFAISIYYSNFLMLEWFTSSCFVVFFFFFKQEARSPKFCFFHLFSMAWLGPGTSLYEVITLLIK